PAVGYAVQCLDTARRPGADQIDLVGRAAVQPQRVAAAGDRPDVGRTDDDLLAAAEDYGLEAVDRLLGHHQRQVQDPRAPRQHQRIEALVAGDQLERIVAQLDAIVARSAPGEIAALGDDPVVAIFAEQAVIAGAADQDVVIAAAEQQIVAAI